jgi:hypothetical protein
VRVPASLLATAGVAAWVIAVVTEFREFSTLNVAGALETAPAPSTV